jgi:probable rRNA maturation factor
LNVEITGHAIPRFSRREVAELVRKVMLILDRMEKLEREVSDVSIAFIDDAAMQQLNKRFRRKNKTTDVLTFPADDSYADPRAKGRPLGDIVISVDQARRQATTEKHSLATEVRYLIVHGVLHALGYDHETDSGEMNALERDVRGLVGLVP